MRLVREEFSRSIGIDLSSWNNYFFKSVRIAFMTYGPPKGSMKVAPATLTLEPDLGP